jgi:mannose-6-phosphate isomerase-like protein (cupin superfamily)
MRRLLLALPLTLSIAAARPALAQAPAPVVEAVTAAQVQGLIDAAKADRKNGEALVTKTALSLAPYSTVVEYRPGTAPAALHATNAELFYVVDGAATMVTGGAMVGQKDAGPGNWSGTGITAGKSRAIAKGDWIIVPQGTPHQVEVAAGSSGVVLMTIKIPRS